MITNIAVYQSYAEGVVKNHLKVFKKIWVNKVACLLEGVVNVSVRVRVVQVDAEGLLGRSEVKVVDKVGWGSRIFVWMADTKKCKLRVQALLRRMIAHSYTPLPE